MSTYNVQNVELPQLPWQQVTPWLQKVAAGYQKVVGEVNYVFVDDEEILRLNRQFIGHDYYTDHIGFDRSNGRILSGDVYISLDTVRTNAPLYNDGGNADLNPNAAVSLAAASYNIYARELCRVIAHGMLHLCGLHDKTPEERQQMEAAEDKALALLTVQL